MFYDNELWALTMKQENRLVLRKAFKNAVACKICLNNNNNKNEKKSRIKSLEQWHQTELSFLTIKVEGYYYRDKLLYRIGCSKQAFNLD